MIVSMHIRDAAEADIAAMHRIRLAVRENRLTDPGSVQPGHYQEMLRIRGRGWVAEVGGQIVGFAVADATGPTVWALFVDPSFERQGIGRALHDAMVGWLFNQGLDPVSLTTTPGTRAERFYLAAGWQFLRPAPGGEACYLLRRRAWKRALGQRDDSS